MSGRRRGGAEETARSGTGADTGSSTRARDEDGATAVRSGDPRIGLALGGGSARGLAHVVMLEALDELGVRPAHIAGTSIGSIMGSAYAAGLSAKDMRDFCEEMLATRLSFLRRLGRNFPESLTALWSFKTVPLVDGVSFFEVVMPDELQCDFSSLKIPLTIIATDFYAMEQVAITHGPVIPAVTASSSLPSMMRPVEIEGRVLFDGGFVNPTPYDVLLADTDITIAVDVTGHNGERKGNYLPGAVDGWTGAFQIMFRAITREKLQQAAPDIFIRPAVGGYGTMDFFRMREIFAAAEPAKDDLKRRLSALLENVVSGPRSRG